MTSDNRKQLFAGTPKVNREDFKIGMVMENSSSSLELSTNNEGVSDEQMSDDGEELGHDLNSDETMSSDDDTPDLQESQSGTMVR